MSARPEWELVERPLLEQLTSLGWAALVWGDHQIDDHVERSSERDVLLEQRLRSALRSINPGSDGAPWLDDARLNDAVAHVRGIGTVDPPRG